MSKTKTTSLQPVQIPQHSPGLERAIVQLLKQIVYLPIIQILNLPRRLLNSGQTQQDALTRAILDGRVSMQVKTGHAKFVGQFSAETSKYLLERGARFSPKTQSFRILATDVPRPAWEANNEYRRRFHESLRTLDVHLASLDPENIASKIDTEKYFTRSLQETSRAFHENTKSIEKRPETPAYVIDQAREQYKINIEKSIVDFTKEETAKLREMAALHLNEGGRGVDLAEPIRKILMKSTGASYERAQNRANFIAKQETKLACSAYTYNQYQRIGFLNYTWWAHANARPYHKALHGEMFEFSRPPVTDAKGHHNNPGEDWGCLCVAIPVRV